MDDDITEDVEDASEDANIEDASDAIIEDKALGDHEAPEDAIFPLHNKAEAALAAARDVEGYHGEVLYVMDGDEIVDGPFRADVAFGIELTGNQRMVSSED